MILEIGCGPERRATRHIKSPIIGMDTRQGPGVDVVHSIESLPWPFEDAQFERLIAWHVFEHLKPWLIIDIMNECWRVLKVGSPMDIGMPCPGTAGFYQEPTHVRTWNEATPTYFDPAYPAYKWYTPDPWELVSIRRYPKKLPPGVVTTIPEESFHFILKKRGLDVASSHRLSCKGDHPC